MIKCVDHPGCTCRLYVDALELHPHVFLTDCEDGRDYWHLYADAATLCTLIKELQAALAKVGAEHE